MRGTGRYNLGPRCRSPTMKGVGAADEWPGGRADRGSLRLRAAFLTSGAVATVALAVLVLGDARDGTGTRGGQSATGTLKRRCAALPAGILTAPRDAPALREPWGACER